MTFKAQLTNSVLHTLPIVAAFFAPAIYVAMLVFIFVIVDTYLGRKAAMHRGEKITSNRFSDVFAKIIGYAVFLTVGLLINVITGWKYGVWISCNRSNLYGDN
jgi:NhaP-type Na+/H+ or K+/H+ antiporter